MSKTWKIIMKGAGVYKIKGLTMDWERGVPFIDTFEEKGQNTLLKQEFLTELVETLKSNSHYNAFKGIKVISTEGEILTDQMLELGCIVAFTHKDRIIGFLYLLIDDGMLILGLWPREISNLYKNNTEEFMSLIFKLIHDPYFFKGVTFLFPSYYPH